jgi:ADP-glucose pyrophosphorylase
MSHEERAYWRDVGTLDALRAARDDMLGAEPLFNLSNALWPVLGARQSFQAPPTGRNALPEMNSAPALRLRPGGPESRASAT